MKNFIDFGCGDNLKWLEKAKLLEYYTIAINQRKYELMESDKWNFVVDETHLIKFSDEADIPKADDWNCVSVLEHLLEHEIDKELQGIRSKVKKSSVGHIAIDLTDHEGGFRHYYKEDYATDYPVFYLNRIRSDEWEHIIQKYFKFDKIRKIYKNNIIKTLEGRARYVE